MMRILKGQTAVKLLKQLRLLAESWSRSASELACYCGFKWKIDFETFGSNRKKKRKTLEYFAVD